MEANRTFMLVTVIVAGLPHHDWGTKKGIAKKSEADISYGQAVQMIREPKNDYDKNAIMLVIEGAMLGYIPATVASWMAKLIDNGHNLYAKIEAVDLRVQTVIVAVMMAKHDPGAST